MLAWRWSLVGLAALALAGCGRSTFNAEEAANLGEVVCEPDGTRITTPIVRAQGDGVHLQLDNRTGRQVYVYQRQGQRNGNLGNVEPGETEAVVAEGPGSWELICVAPAHYPGEDDRWAQLQVVDPDGLWISDRPDCEHQAGTHPDYAEDFEGGTPPSREGDPVELARQDMKAGGVDVLPADVMERAGYPEALPRLVRLVRDGRVLAVAAYQADGHGGWIHRGVEFCE